MYMKFCENFHRELCKNDDSEDLQKKNLFIDF